MVLTRNNLEWWCERGILFLVLGMLVFAPLAFGAVDAWAFLVVQGTAAVVFVLWAARLWLGRSRKSKILWPPLAWVVLAFTVYAVVRYFTADIEYVARLEFIQVLMFALLFFVIVNVLRGQEETDMVSFTLIAVATFISCYAVAQLLAHSDQVWNMHSGNIARAGGTYISPNHLAGLLGMVLPLALAYLLVGRVKIVTRLLLGYAVLAMCAGLAVTFSRAGWVAAGSGVLLVLGILLGHRNHRLRAVILLAVLLAGGTVFVSTYLSKTVGYMNRVKSPTAEGPGLYDWSSRLTMWDAATRMWRDNPWWGVGPGLFDYRFREYRPETFQMRPDRCHNDYLNLLADWGAVGGIIVLAGIGIFIVGLFKTWPHVRREENDFGTGQSNRFAFFLGATGGLFSLSVHSTMDFNLHIPANALVGVTLLALLASNLRFATGRLWFPTGIPVKLALGGALVLTALFFIEQDWQRGRETYWLSRAERLPNFSPERAATLEKAFAVEPDNFETAYEIGECYRTESKYEENYLALANRAIDWYARAIRLDPHDGYSLMRTGMCLDWIGDHAAAAKFFSEAEAHEPNGYYMVSEIGEHYVETGDYAAARQWFIRSLNLYANNDIARNYLAICRQKLTEKASGKPLLPGFF
ncbi:MAG TPA: O-antigen ligase family protein [Verrucomicrobiae bacterium]